MLRRAIVAFLPAALAAAFAAALPARAAAQATHGVGQFFTAPAADAYLVRAFTGAQHIGQGGEYAYLVVPLAGFTVSGPAVWTLAPVPGPTAADQTVPVGVLLTPGARYAFLMQAGPTGDPVAFAASFSADVLPGGEAGFCDGSGACRAWLGGNDVDRFTLTFGAVPQSTAPEPATAALLGAGLLGLAARRRRR